ncbi:hypothetical protein CGZ80_02055 [Rhodopirellula sp. MGV]|nr:hypothetical protein CGZ80_02055 [Rhodopirellula sp. MGV]
MRGRLGRGRQSDAWQPIAITSTALLSTSTIEGNPTPDAPTSNSALVTLRNADRVSLSPAASFKRSSWVDREPTDAREPPYCVR